jgi:hypothetical protein
VTLPPPLSEAEERALFNRIPSPEPSESQSDAASKAAGNGQVVQAAASAPRPSWLIDAADLLAEPDPGPTPWLIEDLIIDGALVACVGRWKTTKSYALLDLCISIATGRPAFGSLNVPKPGPVVFCNEESGRAALWRRLDALARGRGIDPEALRGRLMVSANSRVKLDDPGWQEELVAIGRELRPRLFALDPLARMKAPAREENAQTDMAVLVEFMRRLRDDTGAAVGFVHHTGHTGEHMRGSSDLESVWESRLTWTRDGQAAVITLKSEHREAEAAEPITYRIGWDGDTRSMRFGLAETTPRPTRKGPVDAMEAWIRARGSASGPELRRQFDITDKTEAERRADLVRRGITYDNSSGTGLYVAKAGNGGSGVGVAANSDSEQIPLNDAGLSTGSERPEYSYSGGLKGVHLQGFPDPSESGVPTGHPSPVRVGPEDDENELERLRAKYADIAEGEL